MEYPELVWADKHVAMTKETVRSALGRLHAIAPSLHQGAPSGGAVSGNAPEFRYLARQLVAFTRPQRQLTTTAENEQVMAPARAEITRFRQGLEGTDFADQFDVAQAGVAHELTVTTVVCAAPSQTDPQSISDEAVAIVRRQLAVVGGLDRRT